MAQILTGRGSDLIVGVGATGLDGVSYLTTDFKHRGTVLLKEEAKVSACGSANRSWSGALKNGRGDVENDAFRDALSAVRKKGSSSHRRGFSHD